MDNSEDLLIEQTESSTNTEQQWQRISPIALIYFMVAIVKNLIGNFIYIIPAIIAGYSHLKENPTLWFPIFIVVVCLLITSIFLTFYFFQYRLTNQHIEIKSGVFARKHINLPFDRIQNVKLEQPIYYRPFNSTCLILDTAGSNKQEAKVVAINIDFAEHLKQQILAVHKTTADQFSTDTKDLNPQEHSKDEANAQTEIVLNKRNLSDLIIHGLSNNRVWIFLAGLAPFFDNIARSVDNWLTGLGINTEQLFSIADKSWWQISFYALTLTFLILLPITLFSVFGAIISFYDFTLSKLGDRYIRRSGLLTKHEVTMKLSRLQMVIRQQDWLDILLKRINVKFEQNQAPGQNLQAGAQNNKIIIPSVRENECRALINDVYPDNNLLNITFNPISKRYLKRNLGYILLPIYVALVSFFIYVDKPQIIAWLTPFFAFVTLLIVMKWRRWGYAKDENYIYVRKGAFGVDYYCFPLFKVQQSQFKQSVFLRKHQLCTVQFILASGSVAIPYINQQSGYELIDSSLYQVEQSKRSWM